MVVRKTDLDSAAAYSSNLRGQGDAQLILHTVRSWKQASRSVLSNSIFCDEGNILSALPNTAATKHMRLKCANTELSYLFHLIWIN